MKNYVDKDKLAEFATKLHNKQKTIFATKNEVGSPLTAATVADMTDETKVYVYTGNEAGYTSGNWYYYDGSAWVSGGIYNATAYDVDTTLTQSGKPADAKATGDKISILDNALNGDTPKYGNVYYVSKGLGATGAFTNTNTRICTGNIALIKINSGDIYYCDSNYEFRVGIYNAQEISSANFNTWLNEYSNGYINIPKEYEGKYAAVVIRKIGYENSDISADIPTITNHIKYLSFTKRFEDIDNKYDFAFLDGNNIISYDYVDTFYNGIHLQIKNGIFSVSGTSSQYLRFKVINGFDQITGGTAKSDKAEWKAETISEFQINKQYSLHNLVLSGTLPNNVGVTLRDSSGSIILSKTVPEATISVTPAYAVLIIPVNTEIDVSFAPIFIEGGINDEVYLKQINPYFKTSYTKYKTPDLTRDFIYDVNYQSAIKLPENYKADGEPTSLIILCHGLSSTINSSSWGQQTVVNKFVNAGYAVMDVNQVTNQDWCNPALVKKYIVALKDITSKYNVTPKYIYGLSMGSLIGLCLSTVIPDIKACAISGIRLDFEARYNELSSEDRAIVNANLGFINGFDAYKAAGWCKTAYNCIDSANNKINPIQFPPTIFIYGTEDNLTKTESLTKIDEIKRGGTICVANEYTGNHGDVCTLSAGTSLEDTLTWFNDWN